MCQLEIVKASPDSNKIRNTDSRRDLTENAAQFVKIHRLRQMEIESGFSAALNIVTRCKARYRHGFHSSFSFRFHNDIVAVAIWQRDIAQYNIELLRVDHVHGGPCIISRGNVMAKII